MPSGAETSALLARTEVFGHLEERELGEVVQVAVPRSWERGEVVFREGDEGDTTYLLMSGAVLLTREHHGRVVAIAELRGGDMFGELAMFRGETRSATAEAIEPTEAVALLAPDVQRLIRGNPDIATKLLKSLAERVSRTTERLLSQSFQTVAGRVASALLQQSSVRKAERGGTDGDVLIQATQAEIAGLAGTSRESASRFLASLERDGVVTLGRGKVLVHDPERLRNYIH